MINDDALVQRVFKGLAVLIFSWAIVPGLLAYAVYVALGRLIAKLEG